MRGRVLVAIIVLLCLMGMDFIDPGAIAREVVSQYRWRMAMYPTVLTVEQEKAKAKPSLSKNRRSHRSADASDPISVNGSSKCLLGNLVIPNNSAKNEWASRRSPVARLLDA